jgi:branched-chain amino acid transport system substrate-binding protein
LGREGYDGALMAIREINDSCGYPFTLVAETRDPAGETENYAGLCRDILKKSPAKFIVGCTTSWSRKEVIPVLEKSGAQLWYPCAYEGFECSDNVVYVGACPNQNVVPLLNYILARYSSDPMFVGSNYIWGWEINRIARELVGRVGGTTVGERYIPLGDVDIAHIIDEIRQTRPGFILNTLIGPSSVAFFEAYHELGKSDPAFSPSSRPVVSCDWTEPEVASLGPAAIGHFNIAPYFQSLDTPHNKVFLAKLARFCPDSREISAFFAQAYASVHMIARGIAATGKNSTDAVLLHAVANDHDSPFGPVRIQRENNHAVLRALIGRASMDGGFEIVSETGTPIIPDPYLAHAESSLDFAQIGRERSAPYLKVVK